MSKYGLWYQIPDKSTHSSVFLKAFFISIHPIIGVFYIFMTLWNFRYSDEEKNQLRTRGSLLGLLMLPALISIIGAVFLIKYVRRTYISLKLEHKVKPISDIQDSENMRYSLSYQKSTPPRKIILSTIRLN